MMYLIIREINKDARDLIISIILAVSSLFAFMFLYMLLKDNAVTIGEYIFGMPEPIYRFLGFNENPGIYNLQFYNKIYLMVANVIVIALKCIDVFGVIERDEEDGSVFFLCSQLFTRGEIIICKYVVSVIKFAVEYVFIYVAVVVTEWIADMQTVDVVTLITENLGLMAGSICIGIMYISITYIYAVYGYKKDEFGVDMFVFFITFILIMLGNIFRIVKFAALLISKTNEELGERLSSLKEIEWIRNISPVSHINPFNGYDAAMWVKVCLASLVLSVLCFLAAVFLYKRRHIEY